MIINPINLFRLTKAQLKQAAQMVARAFQDDPLYICLLPDAEERKKILPYFYQFGIRFRVLYGEIYATSQKLEGIVAWIRSEKIEKTLWKNLRAGWFSFSRKVDKEFISRRQSIAKFSDMKHKLHAPFRHWYLSPIAIDSNHQGKGYASILMKPMLDRIDQELLPCYLEAYNEKNIPIYEHYGFKLLEKSTIPGINLSHWAMLREPSAL